MIPRLPNVFESASAFLRLFGKSRAKSTAPIEQILLRLGYMSAAGAPVSHEPELLNRVALLGAAAKFQEAFELVAPDAPGLACFGGIFRPCDLVREAWEEARTSATGAGLDV